MNRKHGFRRYLRASLRDTWVLVREFRNSLMLFTGLLLLGGMILWRFYVSPETGQRLAFSEALYAVFTLVFFQTTIPYPHSGLLQVFFFVVPILGLGVIAEGVIRFGVMLFNKQGRKGEWQVAVVSTFRNHIVVCGLGRVGYRVAEQLLRFGEEVVGIDRREESRFVERVREMGVPVVIADAREREALVKAGVPRARAIIPCTEDDLTNLAIALDAILRQLVPEDGERVPRSVLLIAPHANANPTWMGDLAWVKGVLAEMGATVAATLTHDTALSDFQNVPSAEGCIVLSHDAGQKAAEHLAQRYGIEQWGQGLPLPIGFTNTRRWLTELGKRLGAEAVADRLITEGEKMVVEVCRRKGLEISAMHRAAAAIVADATVGMPLVRFITEDLEMIPKLISLRSGQTGTKELLERELTELALSPRVLYNADVYQSKMALAEARPQMVLASNIERHATEDLDIPFVFRLVNPISRFRLIDRAYWGYVGMLNLIESIQNDWLDRYRSKGRRYKARW